MKTYTVWIEIEEYDSETDSYNSELYNRKAPEGSSFCDIGSEFATLEEAQAYAESLYGEAPE